MKKRIVSIIMIILTVALLVAALLLTSDILTPKKISHVATVDVWDGFYNEPKNSVDVIYVGPSTMYYGISPTEIYDKYGFTGYDLASPVQNYFFSKLYIEEAIKTQPSIKVVVLENLLYQSFNFGNPRYEAMYRTTIDNLNLSWNKIKAAWTMSSNSDEESFLSFVFPTLRYHDRWKELTDDDFEIVNNDPYYLKGYSSSGGSRYSKSFNLVFENPTDEVDDSFDEQAVQCFYEIKELCDKNGITLVSVRMPVFKEATYNYARHNASVQFFEDAGVDFIDFNMEDVWNDTGLNIKYDFVSNVHCNINGSDKVCQYLGEYLSEKYDLPDHRNDETFNQWNESVTETRYAQMKWLASAAKNSKAYATYKTSLAYAVYNTDTKVKLVWPMLSYVDSVKIYKNDGDKKELILETDDKTKMLVSGCDNDTFFTIEYTLDKCDEVCEVIVKVTPPMGYSESDEGVVTWKWCKFDDCINYELIRYDLDKKNPEVLFESDSANKYVDESPEEGYYVIKYEFADHTYKYKVKYEY